MSSCEDAISQQFILLYQTVLSDSKSNQEKLDAFLSALRFTCPKLNPTALPLILSYEEIILLNGIAVCQAESGQLEHGISLLYQLKMYYERHTLPKLDTSNYTKSIIPGTCTTRTIERYVWNTKTYGTFSFDVVMGGEYSDWSTDYPTGVDASLIESRTEYR